MEQTDQKKNSSGKEKWFKLIALLLPVLFFLALELLLRLINYGHDYTLFIEDPERPGYLVMNPYLSEKYFTQKQNATVGFFEPFKAEKPEGTFRIFVLGASTAVGFPYLHNGSFHRMLRHRLEQTYSDTEFEVINLALTAINSYALQDMAAEVIEQQPDAVLIYAGHNEYYGALGVGSSSQLGSFPSLVRLALKLREYRSVQLIYDAYFNLQSWGSSSEPDLQQNLMKRMVNQQEIAYGSEIYHAGIAQFDSNMDLLLKRLRNAEVPVFFSKVVINEKDQAPFISRLLPHTDQLRWKEHFEQMKLAIASGNDHLALEEAHNALAIDSTQAELYFLMGRVYQSLGKTKSARVAYQKAALYDHLRFRAPPEINQLISEKAEKYAVTLVDTEEHLRQKSPGGIIGNELVLEHLHPNLDGYMLMADAFYKKMLEQPVLPNPRPINLAQARMTYPITEIDSLFGAYTTMILKQGWPFNETIDIDTANRSLPEAIAGALAVKQLSWEAAMEKLYQHYHQREVYDSALRVMEAVILEYPDKPEIYAKAGSLSMRMRAFDKGSAFFAKAYSLQKDHRYAYYAALCMIQDGRLQASASFLRTSFQGLQPDTKSLRLMTVLRQIQQMEEKLSSHEDPELLNSLARNYYMIGLGEKARNMAEQCLILEPENAEAAKILRQIDAQINS